MSSHPEAHSSVKKTPSQHEGRSDQQLPFHTTSLSTPPPSPASSMVMVSQDQSNSNQRPDLRGQQAKRILQSCDVRSMELLCRFGLCGDEAFPASILQGRQESRLDIILKCLNIDANNWDRDAKVSDSRAARVETAFYHFPGNMALISPNGWDGRRIYRR